MNKPLLHLRLEGIPPSSNHAYTNGAFGRRMLSKAGKAYKERIKQAIIENPETHAVVFDKSHRWLLLLTIESPDLYSAGWPKKAKNRFRTFDVSNRVKLLEDAIKDGVGLDDSCTFSLLVSKVPSEKEHSTVMLFDLELGEVTLHVC